MLKYVDTLIGLREIPDEISLCINISNCPIKCNGCHSSYLQEDIGTELTEDLLETLIESNEGISCICIMGGSQDIQALNRLMAYCKRHYPNLKTAVYLGNDCFPYGIHLKLYDYIKIGHYDEKLGGLDSPTTNQKLKLIEWVPIEDFKEPVLSIKDITYKFQKPNYES